MSRVAVIGAGSWGTAASGLAAANADDVTLWCHGDAVASAINETHVNPRYLVDYHLPTSVHATSSLSRAFEGVDAALFVVPSNHLRDVAHAASSFVPADLPVCVLTKGIEAGSGMLMSDVVASELGGPERVAALSGPNHAEEVCRSLLAAAVVAAKVPEVALAFQGLLVSQTFRVYVSSDVIGVETCGAVKNVIAIACGVAAGLGAGDNTEALIMTRGLAETSRIANASGGLPMTCMGLAGMGDLVATCTSPHSRNRSFGLCLSKGETLESYEGRTHMVVEGARAARSVRELAGRLGVEAPITNAVHDVLFAHEPVCDAMSVLLDRLPREEFYGLGDVRG